MRRYPLLTYGSPICRTSAILSGVLGSVAVRSLVMREAKEICEFLGTQALGLGKVDRLNTPRGYVLFLDCGEGVWRRRHLAPQVRRSQSVSYL